MFESFFIFLCCVLLEFRESVGIETVSVRNGQAVPHGEVVAGWEGPGVDTEEGL